MDLFDEKRGADILIFGLEIGRLKRPFRLGELRIIPDFDIRRYLTGYEDDDIDFIADQAKFAEYRHKPKSLSFSLMTDDLALIPLRLFKTGWLSGMKVIPVTNVGGIQTRGELNTARHLMGQIWADGNFRVSGKELPEIRKKYGQLLKMPKGYLEMALRRFSRCYKYIQHSEYPGANELDDYWVDLIIALESITTKRHEGITANLARRTAKLLGKNQSEVEAIENKAREMYDERCAIVHGEDKDITDDPTHEKRFVEAENLRSLVRDTINACLELLTSPGLTITKPTGVQKTMAETIDEKYP